MRAPLLDERLAVRCAWEGAVGASQSVVRLHGREVARNRALIPQGNDGIVRNTSNVQIESNAPLPAPHPLGLTQGSRLFQAPTATGLTVANHYNVGGITAATWGGRYGGLWFYTDTPLTRLAFLSVNRGPQPAGVWTWLPPLLAGAGSTLIADTASAEASAQASIWVAGVLCTDDPRLPYFDGDTTAPEVLMSLYSAMAEGHPPPR